MVYAQLFIHYLIQFSQYSSRGVHPQILFAFFFLNKRGHGGLNNLPEVTARQWRARQAAALDCHLQHGGRW